MFPVVTGFKDISFYGSSVSFSLVNVACPFCVFLSMLAFLDLPNLVRAEVARVLRVPAAPPVDCVLDHSCVSLESYL